MSSNCQQVDDLRWKKFPVGSDGFVCLVDCMGDDAAVTQAARVSYGKDAREEGSEGSGDRNLIRYLMRHRHSTPFEMAEIKLLVRVPMDTWRQWIRHRTANVNEYSTRYQPAIDSMATTAADAWRLQASNNKQGSDGILQDWPEGWRSYESAVRWHVTAPQNRSWDFVKSLHPFTAPLTPGEFLSLWERQNHRAVQYDYNIRLELGVAREVARKDLPLSTYTEAYWKCDLHNILHFLGLRMDSHAQQEIREYATIIGEQIIAPLFPEVWAAFVDYRLNGTFLSGLDKQVLKELLLRSHSEGMCLPMSLEDVGEVLRLIQDHVPEEWKKPASREAKEFTAKLQAIGIVCQ